MQLAVNQNRVNIAAQAYPWTMACKHSSVDEGPTIEGILLDILKQGNCPFPLQWLNAHVYVGASYVPRSYWRSVTPKGGSTVTIKIIPGKGSGGKNPLATILSIAVIAAAAWAGPAFAGAFQLAGTAAKIGGALVTGLVAGIGNLLIAAIAPPPQQRISGNSSTQASDSQTLFIQGARNTDNPFGVVPIILGKHIVVPPLAANNFTETAGDQQFVRQLFCWGLGKYELSNLSIGTTSIDQFTGVQLEHALAAEGSAADFALYPNSVIQEDLQIQCLNGVAQVRTSQPDADELSIDITFPKGLFSYDAQGTKQSETVSLQVRYAPTGTTSWVDTQTITATRSQTSVVRVSASFVTSAPGTYDIEVTRQTADAATDQIFNDTFFTALRTIVHENPINIVGISATAIRILATDQLNGAVDQLSGVLFSIVPDWDTDTEEWVERTSNNPASLIRYVLQNAEWFTSPTDCPNVRPLADNRIDITELQEFHEFCVSNGFEYNGVIDFETNVNDVVNEIAAAGRASMTLTDGKWSIVIDRVPEMTSQFFSAANSWGFQGNLVFPEIPNALRVIFLNEDKGYIQDERLVFDDGYSERGEVVGTVAATVIQQLDLPGITSSSLVWKHGRKYLAEMRLRPREISFYCDTEHLAASKGCWIDFAHPVALVGVTQGYINKVNRTDDGIVSILLDRYAEMDASKSYKVKIRNKKDNSMSIHQVVTVAGTDNQTLTFVEPITDTVVNIDDLFGFGEADYETIKLLVRDIVPGKDLTARLVCQDAAPAIFDADTGIIPPFTSRITVPLSLQRPLAPVIVAIQTGIQAQVINLDGSISSRMIITVRNDNPFDCVPVVKIRAVGDTDYEYATMIYRTAIQATIEGLTEGRRYDIQIYYQKVINSDITGLGGNTYSAITASNNVLYQGQSDNPPDVTGLQLQIIDTSAVLSWNAVTVIDFDHYEIRFTPTVNSTNWGAAATIRDNYTHTEVTLATTPGTYMVKAFDRGGRESPDPATITTIVEGEGLNAVATATEDPTFGGTHDNTTVNGGNLELDDLTLGTGIYYFASVLDLTDVFYSKVAPVLIVEGHNTSNFISAWSSLSSVSSMSGAASNSWGALLQESHTNDDPGGSPTWTSWMPLTPGYLTFRAIKFRAVLTGNGSNITPSISSLGAVVDMPDRIEKADNVAIPDTGLTVVFADDFNAKPINVITILDGQEGDVVEVTSEDAHGFTINVTNASAGVARHMNYHSIGYGRKIT